MEDIYVRPFDWEGEIRNIIFLFILFFPSFLIYKGSGNRNLGLVAFCIINLIIGIILLISRGFTIESGLFIGLPIFVIIFSLYTLEVKEGGYLGDSFLFRSLTTWPMCFVYVILIMVGVERFDSSNDNTIIVKRQIKPVVEDPNTKSFLDLIKEDREKDKKRRKIKQIEQIEQVKDPNKFWRTRKIIVKKGLSKKELDSIKKQVRETGRYQATEENSSTTLLGYEELEYQDIP